MIDQQIATRCLRVLARAVDTRRELASIGDRESSRGFPPLRQTSRIFPIAFTRFSTSSCVADQRTLFCFRSRSVDRGFRLIYAKWRATARARTDRVPLLKCALSRARAFTTAARFYATAVARKHRAFLYLAAINQRPILLPTPHYVTLCWRAYIRDADRYERQRS